MKPLQRTLSLLSLATVLLTQVPASFAQKPLMRPSTPVETYLAQTSVADVVKQGVTKGREGDYEGAIADFTRAIKLDPKNADAYFYRGFAYRFLAEGRAASERTAAMDDLKQAIVNFDQTVKIDPSYIRAYFERGLSQDDLGKKQEAISDYTQTLALDAEFAEAYYNRGVIHDELGEKKEALGDFVKARDLYQQQGKTDYYRDAVERIRQYEGSPQG